MYLATEPTGEEKALKVVAKEQLKSSKNKGKVSSARIKQLRTQRPQLTSVSFAAVRGDQDPPSDEARQHHQL